MVVRGLANKLLGSKVGVAEKGGLSGKGLQETYMMEENMKLKKYFRGKGPDIMIVELRGDGLEEPVFLFFLGRG